jgi:hypothetical protein
LLAGEAAVRDKALNELTKYGAAKSRRKWWAFQGFTSVDCWLETDSLLLLIEGKRTEGLSASTDWFSARNQVARILEGAKVMADGRRKNFAVLVCAESLMADLEDQVWASSLPHLSDIEIEKLKSHYLGWCSWSSITQQLCTGLTLPENIDEAIAICLQLRQGT